MTRAIDWRCSCSYEILDCMAHENERKRCPRCGTQMEQVWWSRRSAPAQWDDNTSVLVHVTNDPSVPPDARVRYVGSHDASLKPGYERVYLRSLREVERFEKEQNVRSEMAWFDKGTGRGHDDYVRDTKVTH